MQCLTNARANAICRHLLFKAFKGSRTFWGALKKSWEPAAVVTLLLSLLVLAQAWKSWLILKDFLLCRVISSNTKFSLSLSWKLALGCLFWQIFYLSLFFSFLFSITLCSDNKVTKKTSPQHWPRLFPALSSLAASSCLRVLMPRP